jgi:hypothetical protein
MTTSHTLAAQACLGILLYLDKEVVTRVAEYAAEHWADHAQSENASRNVEDGTKHLFHPTKSYGLCPDTDLAPIYEPLLTSEDPDYC